MAPYTTDDDGTATRRQLVLAGLCVLTALVLLNLPAEAQRGVARTIRASVMRPFVEIQGAVTRLRARASEVDQLRAQNDSLIAVLIGRSAREDEIRRLRELLDLRERVGSAFVPATLIRSGTEGSESIFLMDVGGARGVRPQAAVVTRNGLLGRVREVEADQSVGMDWTHPEFRASAMSVDGSAYGIVQPRRGRFREEDWLELVGTDFHTSLEPGTLIVTSGAGGVLPREIPIGIVEEVSSTDPGWRKSYRLRPAVIPASATHALVAVDEAPDPGVLSSAWPADTTVARIRGDAHLEVRAPEEAAATADSGDAGRGPGSVLPQDTAGGRGGRGGGYLPGSLARAPR